MSKQPIILGGGLAGLSACFHGTGVLYEKNVGIGGSASSENKQGFIFDHGIHVMHTTNSYVLGLMDKLNVDMEVRQRDAWICSHGAMTEKMLSEECGQPWMKHKLPVSST